MVLCYSSIQLSKLLTKPMSITKSTKSIKLGRKIDIEFCIHTKCFFILELTQMKLPQLYKNVQNLVLILYIK